MAESSATTRLNNSLRIRPDLLLAATFRLIGAHRMQHSCGESLSPLRLGGRVSHPLVIVPFWALAPYIAHSLSGGSNTPSAADVTTIIVAVQTVRHRAARVRGRRTAVKSIIKGSTMRHALVATWSMLIHGDIRSQSDVGNDPNEERPPHEDA